MQGWAGVLPHGCPIHTPVVELLVGLEALVSLVPLETLVELVPPVTLLPLVALVPLGVVITGFEVTVTEKELHYSY